MILVFSLVLLALLLVFRNAPPVERGIAAAGLIAVAAWLGHAAWRSAAHSPLSGEGAAPATPRLWKQRIYDQVRFAFGAVCAVMLAAIAIAGGTRALSHAAALALGAVFVAGYVLVAATAVYAQAGRRRRQRR